MKGDFPASMFSITEETRIADVPRKPFRGLNSRAIGAAAINSMLTKYHVLTLQQISRLLRIKGHRRIHPEISLKKMHLQGEVGHFRIQRARYPLDLYCKSEQDLTGLNLVEISKLLALLAINEWHTLMLMNGSREIKYMEQCRQENTSQILLPSMTRTKWKHTSQVILAISFDVMGKKEDFTAHVSQLDQYMSCHSTLYGNYLIVVVCPSKNAMKQAVEAMTGTPVFTAYKILTGKSDTHPLTCLYIAQIGDDGMDVQNIDLYEGLSDLADF